MRFDRKKLRRPPEELVRFVQRLTADAPQYEGPERRSEPRWGVVMLVPAVPVDAQLNPAGEESIGISRDLSMQGMSLYFFTPIPVKSLLAVELRAPDGNTIQAVLEVLRCRADGSAFDIGGRFLVKLYGDAPPAE